MICQSCGKELLPGEIAVLVNYGYIAKSGRFYNRTGNDLFHSTCDKAFRKE